jgi:hypothetical protein
MTWLLLPALLVALYWSVTTEKRGAAVLAGALAVCAPFYTHKLLAPHLAMLLVLVALGAAPRLPRAIPRLTLISLTAVLWSVPSWLPVMRGLRPGDTHTLIGAQPPWVADASLVRLFWPVATDSRRSTTGSCE